MSPDTCRLPTCDREPGTEDADVTYRSRRFCSPMCDLKYEDYKADRPEGR